MWTEWILVSLMSAGSGIALPQAIGGRAHDFPAVFQLHLEEGGYCTATLVAEDRLLTAAHCGKAGDRAKITVGRRSILGTFEVPRGYHQGDENGADEGWDVAWVHLDAAIRNVAPWSLEEIEPLRQGDSFSFAGFGCGRYEQGEELEDGVERFASLEVMGREGHHLRTKGDGGIRSCPGDSGGPAWVMVGKRKVLIGVVSMVDHESELSYFTDLMNRQIRSFLTE